MTPMPVLSRPGYGIGQAAGDLGNMTSENIVALCDVDEVRAAPAFQQYPKARKFQDYRKMLEAMEREIDAVLGSEGQGERY